MRPKFLAVLVVALVTVTAGAQDEPYVHSKSLEAKVAAGTATRDEQLELIRSYNAGGRYYEASKLASRLTTADPQDTDAIALRDEAARGLRDVNDKRVRDAEARMTASDATDADRLALANAYFDAGSYGAAAQAYAAVQANTLDRDAQMRRARALAWSGQLDAAEDAYALLLRDAPENAELELEYGRLLSWMGESKLALQHLRHADEMQPTEASAIALANAMSWSGDRQGAMQLLTGYTAAHADAREAATLLTNISTSPDLNVERIDRMIEAQPFNLALRVERARALLAANRLSEAKKELKFVREHTRSIDGLDALDREIADRRTAERQRLEAQLQTMVSSSGDPNELHSLAKAYSGIEDYDRSIGLYERYLSAKPDDTAARIEYARVLGWDRRYAASEREYGRIISDHPDRADLRLERAQVMSYDQDYKGALSEFRQLTDVSSNPRARLYSDIPPRAYFNLGQIYRWFGWNDTAIAQQNQALALDAGYLPARDELDLVRHVRPTSTFEARYTMVEDSNDFTMRRADLDAELWRSQRMAFDVGVGRHWFENRGETIDANSANAGITYRKNDQWTYRGRVGATFYQEGLGTRPFFGVGAQYLPNLQSRAAIDFNHYDLIYDVFALSSLVTPNGQTSALRDPVSIDDVRAHYDYNSGGFWSALGDASYGFISDDNRRAAAHGLLTFRLLRSPFVAVKADGRYLSYDERTPRYWSPTDYKSLAGVLQVGDHIGEKFYWDVEGKYGRAWEGNRNSDIRTISAKATVPLSDSLDLVGSWGYGRSGRLESVFGNGSEDFVNYWQRNWYVGVRVKRLFAGSDRQTRNPYYYDNQALAGSPLATTAGEIR